MIPAYVPNPMAVVLGGGVPIDGGRLHADGNRLLGDGKTVRGFLLGTLAGILAGGVQISLQTDIPAFLPRHTLLSVILLATGALTGDLVKSYFKRRRGIPQGEKWPVADQYDLVLGALGLTLFLDPAWVLSAVSIPVLLGILVETPLLHRAVNLLGHSLGVKDVPW
jgi:CDP-2,3-bis-(O-geranylgeranyl)-sn-glycerol synthase